jgi:hypothetical protein
MISNTAHVENPSILTISVRLSVRFKLDEFFNKIFICDYG